ncbi:MAG: pantoate--beta-alanine ligase [Alistipes sp.]|jgi:pantoate--beta-alanine ligase|nr:pantoate--beta-alanine ligase [Alistipes sp.]
MKVANTRGALDEFLSGVSGKKIVFVPTMGALHEGHLSLVRAARESGGVVVVSIFVNPTQFNDPDDLKNYPRTPERDLSMLEEECVDVVFMPSVEDIYPEPDTRVWDFGELDKVMEGATRPGHFNGVAQVVSRLFDAVRPVEAFFGQKDFQQVAIIREMVRQARRSGEPWAGVEIVECPTVREEDGLAMSSRNALLSPAHRASAPDIYRALRMGAEQRLSPAEIIAQVERGGLLKVIYLDFFGPRACIAVQAGGVRLIDNVLFDL